MTMTISELMLNMPAAFIAEKAAGVEAVVHFRFTGSEAGEWNAVIKDGKCDVARGLPHSKPTISVTGDSADYVRIVTGELDAGQAVMEGRIRFSGNLDLATRLLTVFKKSQA